MVYDYIWNGIKGKGKKFFVRNIGGMPLYIYSSSFINYSSALQGNLPYSTSEFLYYLHPWRLRPETTKYHNIVTSPLNTSTHVMGGLTYDLERFPPYSSTVFSTPYFHPTLVPGTESVFQLKSGPFITHPSQVFAGTQPLLSGYNIRDYYRLNRKVELKNYESFGSEIEIDVVCCPDKVGLFQAELMFYYDGIDSFGDSFINSFRLICKFDSTNVNFEEIDWTNRSDIFSVEGVRIKEEVDLDNDIISIF